MRVVCLTCSSLGKVILVSKLSIQFRFDFVEAGVPDGPRIALLVIVALGILCVQVVAVCVWRLLTMVRRGTGLEHSVDFLC